MIRLKTAIIHFYTNKSQVYNSIRAFVKEKLNRKLLEIKAKKTIPLFNLKKKSIVGGKITYNNDEGYFLLDSVIRKEMKIKSINDHGFTMGIKEYCQLSLFNYDNTFPLFGFDLTFNFSSEGSRIKERKRNKAKFLNLSNKKEIVTILKERGYEIY